MAVSFCGKRVLLNRATYFFNQKRHGYIVLVPEIGEDLPETNPMHREDGLLEFSNVTIEKCVSLIGKQAIDLEKNVKHLEDRLVRQEKVEDIFKEVIDPLEKFWAPLETTWGLAKALYLGNSTLMPTKSFMTIHDRAKRARVAKFNSLPIYKAIKDAKLKADELAFTEEQKRLLDKYLLEGKMNGMELDEMKKILFTTAMVKLQKEKTKFQTNVDKANAAFKQVITDFEMVREFPVDILSKFSSDPTQPLKGPWNVSLKSDSVRSFLEYCPNRTERWNVWQAENRRASNYNEKSLQNSTAIEEIRFLRKDQSNILGYKNFVDQSMETKMVGKVEVIQDVISNLRDHAKPIQDKEIKDLQEYATKNGFQAKSFEMHDIPYWRRKQLQLLNYDEQHIREYFPVQKVLSGLFELVDKLFQVKIVERNESFDRWHEDVRYFDVLDRDGKYISGFYLDLYSREDEKIRDEGNMGWAIGIRNRSQVNDSKSLAVMIFNFPAEKVYNKPCLLSFRDVHLLFEKFGYILQHLLTRANYCDVAGVSNIEWDAVKISSYVLANFLYENDVLKSISSHYKSGDNIPDTVIKAIQTQRTHLAGFDMCQELYYSALDLELNLTKDFWLEVVRRLWPEYQTIPLDKKDSQLCSMTKIFSGEYGAAYFSDLWSRIVAMDVYSAFYEAKQNEEARLEIGQRYRDTFLALGGACNPNEVFRRFRGRDPSPKALLRALGLRQSLVKK